MGLKLANNATSKLAASLAANDTMIRILVGTGARFPELLAEGDWFPLAIQNDLGEIEYTRAVTRVGDTVVVVRGQEGSQPRDFNQGDAVFLPLTKGVLETIQGIAGPISLNISDSEVTA